MLLVTFHGGKPEQGAALNNVHAYDKSGKRLSTSVLDDAAGVKLDELRGLCLRGGLLYVVNANKDVNSVLCYRRKGRQFRYASTFASHKTCAGIVHPFDLAFDDDDHCYVSSQDTNVITRLKVSKDGLTGTASKIAPALVGEQGLLPGTFVASSVADLAGTKVPGVKGPGGLGYSGSGLKQHSVRGVLWAKGALYVADEPNGRVKAYDPHGKFLGQSEAMDSPVHLMEYDGHLYVSGGKDIVRAKLARHGRNLHFVPAKGLDIKDASAMVFTGGGKLYAASRTEKKIRKFNADFKPMPFKGDLPDCPEFLLHLG